MNRVTHAYDGPLALFLIGLRIHKPWHLRTARAAALPMQGMIVELEANRAAADRGEAEDLGYLASRTTVGLTGVTMIQWWRSVEDIYAYANAGDRRHRPAWVEFYRVAKERPDVATLWHETYDLTGRGVESAYAGPKPFGLASLAGVVPMGRRGEVARARMGGTLRS